MQFTFDIGGKTRNVFAGIKAACSPKALVGKHTVMVANLKPRTMKLGMSAGMALAADPDDAALWFPELQDSAEPGMPMM
ncbi:hypothetical protein GCM10023116_12150 [Kistimonas scapharcae]|uniref:tRNA-binding domain-containing protein n=2 Tax=Kistimonas scapharcae TaxID=1036133 RepID=A0ABP8UYI2_9GAMM